MTGRGGKGKYSPAAAIQKKQETAKARLYSSRPLTGDCGLPGWSWSSCAINWQPGQNPLALAFCVFSQFGIARVLDLQARRESA